jgi:hypothetical protein
MNVLDLRDRTFTFVTYLLLYGNELENISNNQQSAQFSHPVYLFAHKQIIKYPQKNAEKCTLGIKTKVTPQQRFPKSKQKNKGGDNPNRVLAC